MHRSAEVQDVLREIAETAISGASLDELYRRVHRSIDRILPASLFHVSLLDEVTNEIVVIYMNWSWVAKMAAGSGWKSMWSLTKISRGI